MWLSPIFIAAVRLLVGAHPRWAGCLPGDAQRIYFANHSSHLDALTVWSSLPSALRRKTRPVAAEDYWGKSRLRRRLALNGFNAVFIQRIRESFKANPLTPLTDALERGDSLIIFPEGTRIPQPLPSPFKSGLYHLARRFPTVELIPVYLENLHRSMPKGTYFPLPIVCTVRFGAPLPRIEGEDKLAFLNRARQAVVELA